MADGKNLEIAVTSVFEEREKFVVLGLTGRTGSGCSTAAAMLQNPTFEEFLPPEPKAGTCCETEERQYRVLHGFLKENWYQFHVIRAADVISSFVLEYDYETFVKQYSRIPGVSAKNIRSHLSPDFERQYSALHQEREAIRERVIADEKALEEQSIYDFNFHKLPKFTTQTKELLDRISKGSYTKFYQSIANNIRRSGFAFSAKFDPTKIFRLAQRVNSFIKQLRRLQKIKKGRVLVCIDAIRNSFEATFFRERYASFYLVAVSTDEIERRRRLRTAFGYSEETINQIDSKECPKKLSEEEFFYSQNIQKCVEMADIHIYNPSDSTASQRSMKSQLVKYVSLIMHPGLVQPTDIERCMQIAINAKFNSGCISRQVGAVITDEWYSVKAIGWNSSPERQVPCSHRTAGDLLKVEDATAFSDYELSNIAFRSQFSSIYKSVAASKKSKGWPISFCFKDVQNCIEEEKNQVHTRALHAEENAFLQITKYGGQGIKDGYLFTTSSPCDLCAKKAYQLGIRRIFYLDPYPGIAGEHVLSSGCGRPEVVPFFGAVGRGYQQLFDPVMPHKEAIKALLGFSIPNPKTELKKKITELEQENARLKGKLKESQNGRVANKRDRQPAGGKDVRRKR